MLPDDILSFEVDGNEESAWVPKKDLLGIHEDVMSHIEEGNI